MPNNHPPNVYQFPHHELIEMRSAILHGIVYWLRTTTLLALLLLIQSCQVRKDNAQLALYTVINGTSRHMPNTECIIWQNAHALHFASIRDNGANLKCEASEKLYFPREEKLWLQRTSTKSMMHSMWTEDQNVSYHIMTCCNVSYRSEFSSTIETLGREPSIQ